MYKQSLPTLCIVLHVYFALKMISLFKMIFAFLASQQNKHNRQQVLNIQA